MVTTTSTVEKVQPVEIEKRHAGWWTFAIRRFRRNKLAMPSLIFVLILAFAAIFAPFVAPYDPIKPFFGHEWETPTIGHLMGMDPIGRDQFSRIIWAGRTSLLVGVLTQVLVFSIGIPLGAIAGFRGGKIDFLIMRMLDVTQAFPALVFQLVIAVVLGPGLTTVLIALTITGWTGSAWLIRSQSLSLREKDYILAARSMGATTGHIIRGHLIPNALGPVIVAASFGIPGAIAAEAALSFLGLGINPPTPSWGQMLGTGGQNIGGGAQLWHLIFFPAATMALVLLAFQFLGDGIRDALDPNSNR